MEAARQLRPAAARALTDGCGPCGVGAPVRLRAVRRCGSRSWSCFASARTASRGWSSESRRCARRGEGWGGALCSRAIPRAASRRKSEAAQPAGCLRAAAPKARLHLARGCAGTTRRCKHGPRACVCMRRRGLHPVHKPCLVRWWTAGRAAPRVRTHVVARFADQGGAGVKPPPERVVCVRARAAVCTHEQIKEVLEKSLL